MAGKGSMSYQCEKEHVLVALILSHHCWGRITSEVIPCLLAKKDHCDIYKFLVRTQLERYENNLRDTAEKKTGGMLLKIHLLLSLVLHVYGLRERDRACTMLIVVDQV